MNEAFFIFSKGTIMNDNRTYTYYKLLHHHGRQQVQIASTDNHSMRMVSPAGPKDYPKSEGSHSLAHPCDAYNIFRNSVKSFP